MAGLGVPYLGRGPKPSIELFRNIYKDRFFYQLYFQEPGVAEAELEADVRTKPAQVSTTGLGRTAIANATIENPTGPGLLDRLVDPDPLPPWLTEADLDYYAGQFQSSGFRGPLNRYRNSERDFEQLAGRSTASRFTHPTAFMAGSLEPVLRMVPGVDMVELMRKQCADLRQVQHDRRMPAIGCNKSGRPWSTRRCLSFCAAFHRGESPQSGRTISNMFSGLISK